jgi:branched-chain amino acid transport system substrate-binding protein
MTLRKTLVGALAAAGLVAAGAAQADTVRIGVVLSQSGAYAFVGVPLLNGMKLAHEELMASGAYGPHEVVMDIEDNRSERSEAMTLVTRFARNRDYDMIIGPIATSEALATGPVANANEIPLFTTATSPAVLEIGPWIFKSTETADAYMEPVAQHIVDELQPESCFIVGIRDNEGYVRQKQFVHDFLQDAGVEIAADESILSTDSDFTALSTKIVATGSPCLFVTAPSETAANVIIQARQAGMPADTILVGDSGAGSQKYIDAGGRAVEGTLFPASFVADASEDASAFAAAYEEEFGMAPDLWAATGHSMMRVVANAVSSIEGDVTRENLREAMAATSEVPVVLGSGRMSFDEDRVPHVGGIVMKIEEGGWAMP